MFSSAKNNNNKKPRFPLKVETLEQNPIQLANILVIIKLGGGNMGTVQPSLSSSQILSIPSSFLLWVEISDLLCFYAFLLLAFLFLSC